MPLQLATAPLKTFGQVIRLEGSLDTDTFGQLETEINRLVTEGSPLVVLDFAALSYISSAGIRVVQKGTRALERSGGSLKLLNPQPQVARVFEVIKMMPIDQLFTTLEDLDAYLRDLQSRPPMGS